MYLLKKWSRDYYDLKYEKTAGDLLLINETLWQFYSNAYPDMFESISNYYFRKSQITPWVILGYWITFSENVTESEAIPIDCAIVDMENGTLFLDNVTKIIALNHTKIQCERREGYCKFDSPWLRKGNGVYYCKCTGQWAGDRCNDIPIWGKVILGAFGLFLVILVIVLVVRNRRKKRQQVKEDKAELVETASQGGVDNNTFDGNSNLKGVSEIEYEGDVEVQRPVTPDLLHNRKKIPIPRLPMPSSPDDKKQLRLEENEEYGTTNL